MPENKPQLAGALRLAQLRTERDQVRQEQPGAESSTHPRADVYFLLDTLALTESTIDAIFASHQQRQTSTTK